MYTFFLYRRNSIVAIERQYIYSWIPKIISFWHLHTLMIYLTLNLFIKHCRFLNIIHGETSEINNTASTFLFISLYIYRSRVKCKLINLEKFTLPYLKITENKGTLLTHAAKRVWHWSYNRKKKKKKKSSFSPVASSPGFYSGDRPAR